MSAAPARPPAPHAPGAHDPAPLDPDALATAARAQLARNDVGTFVKPAERQYPHQWNWDAALVALGLSAHAPERARDEVRTLLRGAWSSGMVPHILYPHGASDYRPDPDAWRTAGRHPHGLPTSGLSQPPVLATCLRRMHDRAPDEQRPAWRAFLRETYPAVLAWHRWWHEARDPDRTGLACLVHPWESGSDDAPRFDVALAAVPPLATLPFARADRTHVAAAERPSDDDYARYLALVARYADLGWDDAAVVAHAPFRVEDPFLIAVLHRADADLAAIADLLGEPRDAIDGWRAATTAAYPQLWDPTQGRYAARDARTGRPLPHAGFAGLAALWGRLAPTSVADAFADDLRAADGRYRHPTVDPDAAPFQPRRYWRGPVWIVVNWMLADGFAAYGHDDVATRLRDDALALVARRGFFEHYDPGDGTPGGAAGFSWSAALTLDLLRSDGAPTPRAEA